MNIIIILKISTYFIFGLTQAIGFLFSLKTLQHKAISHSFKVMLTGLALMFFCMFIFSILNMFFQIDIMNILSGFAAIISGIIIIITMQQHNKILEQEITRQKKIEAEALRIAEINNIADETYLRAKNLLSIGNKFLVLTANAVRKKIGHEEIFNFINDTVISEAFADGGIVLAIDEFAEELKVKSLTGIFPPPYKLPDDVPHKPTRVQTSMKYADFKIDNNIFGEVAKRGKSLLIENAGNDKRIFENGKEYFLEVGSYLFLPLIYNNNVSGIIGLSRSKTSPPFNKSDEEICNMLAGYASTAIHVVYSLEEESEKDTIENEIDLASKIQKMLIPVKLPKHPEIDSAVFFKPAKGICSDYYDIIRTGQDKIFFIILDVAGKSMQASIIMIMIRTLLYLTTNTPQHVATILNWINKGITDKISIDHFAGLSLVQYNPTTKKLTYSGAGNMSISIFNHKEKKITQFSQTSDAIGIDTNSNYTETILDINSNDILLMYTDGVIETIDNKGNRFSIETIYDIIQNNSTKTSKDIIKTCTETISTFTSKSNVHDDQSLMIIKIK